MIENLPEVRVQKKLRIILLLILLAVGSVYVYFALSPSHYGFFLKNHMGQDYQPVTGQAYGIRSDEWGVVTPYFQIAANNDYKRFNQDSPYKEDLRFYYGLPLKDWALAFKPYMWGFFTLGDARGFSFYHFFMIASFIVGYTIFLMQLRLPLLYAAIIALSLFFSHHNQVWWSGNAPVLGLTVWIIIPFLTKWPLFIKFITTFLISAAALFALIYPPWQISLIYVVGFLALAFRFDRFRIGNLLTCFVGFALAAGLCLYYLADIVPLVQNTVYPGDRSFSGGSSQLYYLWTLLFPHSLISPNYQPLVTASNICEIGSVSSILTLCLLVFGDYKSFFQSLKKHVPKLVVLLAFLGILFSWMYLPVPDDIGKFMLLNQIEPKRFLLASGTTLMWLVAILAFYNSWRLSWFRLAIYSAIVLLGSYGYKMYLGSPIAIDLFDVLMLAPVAIIIVLKLFRLDLDQNRAQNLGQKLLSDGEVNSEHNRANKTQYVAYLFAIIALAYNVIAFGGFNPLQSTKDIFSASSSTKVTELKAFATENKLESLGILNHTAAAASGLSLPTYNHVLMTPQVELFRSKFPELDEVKLNTIFNRYMHVSFNPSAQEPILVQADYGQLPLNIISQPVTVLADTTATLNASAAENIQAVSNNWQTPDSLVVKFQSPVALKLDEVSVFAIDENSKSLNAAIRPVLLFSKYFSTPDIQPNAAMMWELDLDFSAVNNANIVYDDLSDVQIQIADKVYNLVLKEAEIVKPFEATQDSYPKQGVIDVATYDAASGTLSVTGWAPINEVTDIKFSEQAVRWFAYDSDLELDLRSLTNISRPDVAKTFGESQELSGYRLVFDVANPPAIQDDIDFCLYSRTKANGTYQLIVDPDRLPLICNTQ